ncbi:MAG: diguanylate cyclase, partial [Cyanobacteria bacterium P01_H01_bin.130]
MTTSPSILVVDDELDNFDVLVRLLTASQVTTRPNIHYAADGHEALQFLDHCQPDLILLDVMMPGLDGIEVCRRLKAMPQWQSVPVIIVTALINKSDLARCLAAGADDFIGKPVNRVELNARVRSMLRIRQQYYELTTFNSRLELMVQQRTAELETLIFQDALTQLPSRAFFLKAVADCLEQGAEGFAIVLLDCDQFQVVNGSFGNGIGDELLVAIAERLKAHCDPEILLARLGEDEFCLLLRGVSSVETLTPFLDRLLGSFRCPFPITHGEFFMTVCAGVTLGGATTEQSPEALLQEADTAMYQAKRRGKGSWQVFDRAMHVALLQQLTLENDLQRSLEQQDFVTYYQPIVDLETRQLVGVEALVRWQHPERGLVPPDSFIPCMEGTGLVIRVGMMVLRQAAYQMHRWHTQGCPDLTL